MTPRNQKTKKQEIVYINEEQFLKQVIELAHLTGWTVAHFRTARMIRANGSTAWLTPVQGDGKGFPDLVMVKGKKLIFAELKSSKGKLTYEQDTWLMILQNALPEKRTYVWRPSDWDEIVKVLE